MDKLNKKVATDICQVSPHVLELILDIILEVMRAEHGSIVLLDGESNELSIKTARGLKEEIIHNARVRLGRGIAGKVAASGQSVFLKGTDEKRQPEIGLEDLVHPEIDTAYVAHGYFVGDQPLRIIADRIKRCIRPTDIVGRIGGEEFGIALINTEKKRSVNVINRIVDAVTEIPTEIRIKLSYPITLSCGISEYPKDAKDSGELVDKAKTALVSAKIMGGNRIRFFETLEE